MTYHTAQIDGWTFSLWESWHTNAPFAQNQFTLTARETIASKVTWAWLAGPRVIYKPVTDLELNKTCEIILTMDTTSWTFQGLLDRWTLNVRFGVTELVIHGVTDARNVDVKTDWRVGLRVTPKLRSHRHFRKCGVISHIDGDHCFISMQDGLVACRELVDDWMTAKQPTNERGPHGNP